jgi:hypothetical protein
MTDKRGRAFGQAAAWPRPDFLARRPPGPPALAWGLLALGAVACALAVADALVMQQALSDGQRDLARWQHAGARQIALPGRSARHPAGAPGQAAGAAEARRAAAAWQLQQRLAHPWPLVFAGVEGAAPRGVQWLVMEHDAERTDLRLEGSAANVQAVLQAVDALATRDVWRDVSLRYIGEARSGGAPAAQAQGSAAAQPALRFELTAQLSRRAPTGAAP